MDNNIQVFTNGLFGSVRVIESTNGDLWFIGNEIASILGYQNTRDALITHVSEMDRNTVAIHDGIPGNPNKVIINESGLYSLIFSSRLPAAKEFTRWVTSEVLPTMRKIGFDRSMQLLDAKYKQLLTDYNNLSESVTNQSIDYHYNTAAKVQMIENIMNAPYLTPEQKES